MNLLLSIGVLYLTVFMMAVGDTQYDDEIIWPNEETTKAPELESDERPGPNGPCPGKPHDGYKNVIYMFMPGADPKRTVLTDCENDDGQTSTAQPESPGDNQPSHGKDSSTLGSVHPYVQMGLVFGGLLPFIIVFFNAVFRLVICKACRRRHPKIHPFDQHQTARKSTKEIKWDEIETSGNCRDLEAAADPTSGPKMTISVFDRIQRALMALKNCSPFAAALKKTDPHDTTREEQAPPSGDPASHSIDMPEGKGGLQMQPMKSYAVNLVGNHDRREADNNEAELDYIELVFGPNCYLPFKDGLVGKPGPSLFIK